MNVLDVLDSGAYHLARSEDEKSGFGIICPVDQARKLFLVVLGALQIGLDLMQIEFICQLGG